MLSSYITHHIRRRRCIIALGRERVRHSYGEKEQRAEAATAFTFFSFILCVYIFENGALGLDQSLQNK